MLSNLNVWVPREPSPDCFEEFSINSRVPDIAALWVIVGIYRLGIIAADISDEIRNSSA